MRRTDENDPMHPAMRRRPRLRTLCAFLMATAVATPPPPASGRAMPFSGGVAIGSLASTSSVAAADFDGDGDLDLAVTDTSGDEVAWLENDGGSWTEHSITTTYDGPDDLVATDMDCDGDADLVFGVAAEDKVAWAENLGAGSWAFGGLVSSAASGVITLGAGLVTPDGKPDVVAILDTGEITLYRRTGSCSANSWGSLVAATGSGTFDEMVLSDVDGDGLLDVVAGEYGAVSTVAYWTNPGVNSPWSQNVVDGAFGDAAALAAGDLDGDGDVDVAACALSVAGDVSWWANPGGAGAWTETPVGSAPGCRALEAADVDRDGDLDLASGTGAAVLSWWDNEAGDGSAWTERTLPATGDPNDLLVADVDGDGDHDLVAAILSGTQPTLYENASTGRSAELDLLTWFFYPFVGGELRDLESGDVDGDGMLDVVGIWFDTSTGDPAAHWFPGLGASDTYGVLQFGFANPVFAPVIDDLESLALGDVDGDGDLDVVIGQRTSIGIGPYQLCSNGGGGTFTCFDISSIANGDWRVDGIELADVDGDRDLDIVATVEETMGGVTTLLWLESSGDPTDPADWLRHPIGPAGVLDEIAVVDLDRDGDPDVVGGSGSWWRNDGAVWAALVIDSEMTGSPVVGDVDGDGDPDVVSVTWDSMPGFETFWFENDLPGAWTRQTIFPSASDLPGSSLALADLDLDGDLDLLSEMVTPLPVAIQRLSWFENDVAAGPGPWVETPVVPAGSIHHLLPGDFDRDGDPDVVTGDFFGGGELWSWVNGGGQFDLATETVAPSRLVDGREEAILAVDLHHRGRAGEASVELAALVLRFQEGSGGNPPPLTQQEVDALVESVRLYRDDGSGTFDAALDELVAEHAALAVADGEALLTWTDGVAALQQPPGAGPATYFLTLELTATASTEGIAALTVTHRPGVACTLLDGPPQLAAAAENAAFDTPLSQALSPPVDAVFDVLPVFIFADGFESGDTTAW